MVRNTNKRVFMRTPTKIEYQTGIKEGSALMQLFMTATGAAVTFLRNCGATARFRPNGKAETVKGRWGGRYGRKTIKRSFAELHRAALTIATRGVNAPPLPVRTHNAVKRDPPNLGFSPADPFDCRQRGAEEGRCLCPGLAGVPLSRQSGDHSAAFLGKIRAFWFFPCRP